MPLTKKIKIIFSKDEISKFWIIFFGILFITILDGISLIVLIPVFNIIFLGKIPLVPFLNFSSIEMTFNIKIVSIILFVLLFYFKNFFIIIFNIYYINFIKKINNRLGSTLFSYFLNQEYIFFLKKSSDNFLQKVNNDLRDLNDFLLSFFNFFAEFTFLILICFLLMIINYKIFLIFFLTFIIVLYIYYNLFKSRIDSWAIIYRKSIKDLQNLVIDGSQGFKDIILYNLRDSFMNIFISNLENSTKTLSRINFLNNVQKYWLELTTFSVLIFALLYFVSTNVDVSDLIPIFGLFIIALFRLTMSFSRIIFSVHTLKFCYPAFVALYQELKDLKNNNKINLDKKITFYQSIEFKNVKFSYLNNNYNILDDISFVINKNNIVNISGPNGSGKTTLLNLIAGIIQPTHGRILIDSNFSLYANEKNWFKKISYVQQNIFLLNDTLKKNITLTNNHEIDFVKFNKVKDSLKLDEFFKNLPNKLETHVGINGINLSGGQKQIISLARALYKDSELIILDEATSSLDENMTLLVKKLILSMKGKKTIIMVTHDADYFLDCFDKIIEVKSQTLKI